MFLDSTKVVIYESTVKGKETGPKKGSEGYIIANSVSGDIANRFLLETIQAQRVAPMSELFNSAKNYHQIKTFYCGKYIYYYIKCVIYFTKFGFEKGERVERKEVINVFPTCGEDNQNICFLNSKVIKNIKDTIPGNYPIVIAIPDFFSPLDNFKKDSIAFEAWGSSILKNNLLKIMLASTGNRSTNIFFENSLLFLLYNNKMNAPITSNNVTKIIPSFKEILSWDNKHYTDPSHLIANLRTIQSILLRAYIYPVKKTPLLNISTTYFIENAWRGACLNKKYSEKVQGEAAKKKEEVYDMQQFLIQSWAKQTKCVNISF